MFQAAENQRLRARPTRSGAGPAWAEWHTKTHRGAPHQAGARVRADPFRASLPAQVVSALQGHCRGQLSVLGHLLGQQLPAAGKIPASRRPGVTRQRPSARRAGRDGGGDSAGWEPGTGSAGRPEPSQGAPRGEDSGRCRHPAGKREREARLLTGRATVGQCVRALGVVSARRRAQPPPPNGHVGVQRFRRLFFLTLRKGLRGGPPPLRLSACLGRPPRRLVAASSCPTSSFTARRLPQPRPVSRPRSAAARGLCDRRARSSRRSANMDAVNAFNQEVRGAQGRGAPGLLREPGRRFSRRRGFKALVGVETLPAPVPERRGLRGAACGPGEVVAATGADPTPLPHGPPPGGDLGLPPSPPTGLPQPAPVPLTLRPFGSRRSHTLPPAPLLASACRESVRG